MVPGPVAGISPKSWLEMQTPQTHWIKNCILSRPTLPCPHYAVCIYFKVWEALFRLFSHSASHLCTCLRLDLTSQLHCQASLFAELTSPTSPTPLDSQSSRVQDQACWVSFVFSSSFLKWESGGRELVSYVCFLSRCVLFKWKVSSGCTHTQIFPCWEHFLWKSK